MPDSPPVSASYAPVGPLTSPRYLWVGRGLLGVFLAYLFFRAWQARTTEFEQIDWRIQDSEAIFAWLRGLLWREFILVGLSFVLGILVPIATGSTRDVRSSHYRWLLRAIWWIFGLAIIWLCFGIAWDELPPLGALLLPYVGYLVGIWLSAAALRGVRPLLFATMQFGAVVLVGVLTTLAVGRAAISSEPLPIHAKGLSTAEKKLLADRIRESRVPEGKPRHIQLNDSEINALLESALNRDSAHRKAQVHFQPAHFTSEASLQLPQPGDGKKFLNFRANGRVSVSNGQLQLEIDQLQVGNINIPSYVLGVLSSTVHTMFMEDPQLQRITEAIDRLELEAGTIDITFQPGTVNRHVVPSLVHVLWKQPDVAFETSVILRHLLQVYETLPADSDRFGKLIESAFTLAAARSRSHDPTLENRAAIFALAILLGHSEIEPFVGEVLDPAERAKVNQIVGRVTLRGRQDLPRHFIVSAALALLSNEATSDRIGVLKELSDAQSGGSGFSFVDLLANFAGIRFAISATRDERSALSMQAELQQGFQVDDFMPTLENLPEDIPEAEFQKVYGDVGGQGYERMIEEIHRRLRALPNP